MMAGTRLRVLVLFVLLGFTSSVGKHRESRRHRNHDRTHDANHDRNHDRNHDTNHNRNHDIEPETIVMDHGPREHSEFVEIPKIGVRDKWMVDQYGRVRMFHGWNSVQKGFPWYTDEMLNSTKLEMYSNWGFNVVRLGCMWAGLEPEEGQYNHTLVDIMVDIVQRLEAHGIYVILDLHQDLFSSRYGSYDGVPLWLVEKFPPPSHPYPWPFHRDRFLMWTDGYLSQAVGQGFQHLYDNTASGLDHWAGVWSMVAARLGRYSNVLGYELMNEPWAGDIYSDPSLLEPGNPGNKNLLPAYNRINTEIRTHDQVSLVFYEPVTWGVFLNGHHSGTGFDSVPGGPTYRDRSVLAYHYYCWLMDISQQHRPLTRLQRLVCDKITGPDVFRAVEREVQRTGGSSFLTEFGACEPDGNVNSSATVECHFVMGMADENFASWTYWDDVFFDADGHVQQSIVDPFVRVYPRAISGTPITMVYTVTDHSFQLMYHVDLDIEQPTEIVIPPRHYPRGFNVWTSKGARWQFNQNTRLLSVYVTSKKFRNKSYPVVSVTLTQK